jgi:hypothetical protein
MLIRVNKVGTMKKSLFGERDGLECEEGVGSR